MTLAPQRRSSLRGNDRLGAIALVTVIHVALGLALVYGLAPNVLPHPEVITRLVEIALPSPPPEYSPQAWMLDQPLPSGEYFRRLVYGPQGLGRDFQCQ